MPILGQNYLGYSTSALGAHTFQSYVPAQNTSLPEPFHAATPEEITTAMQLAQQAARSFPKVSAARRADFLVAITEEILACGDELLERAHLETGLPMARLQGERARTIGQLLLFANLVREGSWVEASIDTAQPDRTPLPKPDLRKMLVPMGTVVVFGSSNFPFAYSVAGVDTAPALAAGNPVVVKAHPAHPGVSDLTAQAILRAAKRTQMPDGVFSMLYDDGYAVGTALVKHPVTKAVGFTGSIRGGMALHRLAQERPDPIPVFAEMGSVNPVVLLPEALETRKEAIAKQLAGSVTLGAGQFCTNPGLVFALDTSALSEFQTLYAHEIAQVASSSMLTSGICQSYYRLRDEVLAQPDVETLAKGSSNTEASNQSQATIARVSGKAFIQQPTLHEEVFGPFSLLVVCADVNELETALSLLAGQLTATVMGSAEEVQQYEGVVDRLAERSGRLIMNGVPTGVEVCTSMQHGGPFPASSDARFGSVGRHAILRFVRPQSFQDWADSLLPDELKNSNPLGIRRLVNDQWTTAAVE